MKLKIVLDNYLKNILCQARCPWEARVSRKACPQVFLHDGFSSDFGILAQEARFGRLRGSQIRKIGCCRTSTLDMTRRAALLRRVITKQWRNSARLGSKLLVAIGVFDRLVLRILKFVLDEIEYVVR